MTQVSLGIPWHGRRGGGGVSASKQLQLRSLPTGTGWITFFLASPCWMAGHAAGHDCGTDVFKQPPPLPSQGLMF